MRNSFRGEARGVSEGYQGLLPPDDDPAAGRRGRGHPFQHEAGRAALLSRPLPSARMSRGLATGIIRHGLLCHDRMKQAVHLKAGDWP